jgi:hypothetical protein
MVFNATFNNISVISWPSILCNKLYIFRDDNVRKLYIFESSYFFSGLCGVCLVKLKQTFELMTWNIIEFKTPANFSENNKRHSNIVFNGVICDVSINTVTISVCRST